MIKARIIKSGFKTAWSHKLRAILMILSIVIGIAALTVIISLGKGTEEKIMSQVKKLFSSNTIMVGAGKARMEGHQVKGPSFQETSLKIADIEDVAERIENIIEWDAIQIAPESNANYNGKNTIVTVSGHTPLGEIVWNIVVTDGRFFSEAENEGLSRVALIAPNVQKELFGNTNPVGQQIKINNIPFQVIGTVAPRGLDPHGIDKDSEVLIPLNTLLRRVVNLDYLMLGKFLVADENSINATAEQVKQILRERHSISPNLSNGQAGQTDDFMVVTPEVVKEMISNANRIFNLYLPLLAIVSLIVGSIVAANLMLLSVNERVKEIGLRKAVGAKSKDILTQFLIEASSITVVSGIFGIVLGIIALSQIIKIMDLPFTISWSALAVCVVVSIITGIVVGFFPAKKAAALQPAQSLR